MLINGSAHAIPLPDKSVHCIVTSSPYFALRKYSGDQGIDWPLVTYQPYPSLGPITIPTMKAPLGLEPNPESFIGHLILIWRELYRVLRDDGVCWAVIGSSFASKDIESNSMVLRDDLTDDEYAYVLGEMAKHGKNTSAMPEL